MPQEQEALADPDYRLDISHFELLVDTWSDVKEASDNMFLRSLVDAIVLQGTGVELEATKDKADTNKSLVETQRTKLEFTQAKAKAAKVEFEALEASKSELHVALVATGDERFATEEHYEWSKDYSHFQHLVLPFLDPSHSVLEIGCGNSRLCEELRKDGVADMTCVDISPVAVERMRSRFRDKGLEGIKVVQADMLDLSFGSEPFDIVIGKGTMDVLFVNRGDSWNPHPQTLNKVIS
ncbi:hypothetical protein ZIOFF_000396 [Zingiber officinale]|uniref:Methyltransferase domain-containing protein n=1 Tax=Zingiber officinale TaxID=94328 RepID=A0A8J5LRE7_ZINOF|nr:hypothetical protein ZIOFF_000396 [Zingiber officinale]